MEFWSKGLGKKTIALGLTRGESLVSEEALCLKGVMEEPVSWEYVMLIDETDIGEFLAILQEPHLAKCVHGSPNRWHLYAGMLKGGVQVAWRVFCAIWRRRFGTGLPEEKVVIVLPPPSMLQKKRRKKALYRRRLSTTTLATPSPRPPSRDAVETLGAESA